jgi:hypothetical protein
VHTPVWLPGHFEIALINMNKDRLEN